MYRLLRLILADQQLASQLRFKGGTYAVLRGILPRFSVDLDFDLPDRQHKAAIRDKCYRFFRQLNLQIKDESREHLQFFLRYPTKQASQRNTLKLEINDQPSPHNHYEQVFLTEVNAYCHAHTLDTMFANKLAATLLRQAKNGKVAGRDFYDLHVFFSAGLPINRAVVEERTGMSYLSYMTELLHFVRNELSDQLLQRDLNPLLPTASLREILPHLRVEIAMFVEGELGS